MGTGTVSKAEDYRRLAAECIRTAELGRVLIKLGARSSPKSGHFVRRPACPLWAKSGHCAIRVDRPLLILLAPLTTRAADHRLIVAHVAGPSTGPVNEAGRSISE